MTCIITTTAYACCVLCRLCCVVLCCASLCTAHVDVYACCVLCRLCCVCCVLLCHAVPCCGPAGLQMTPFALGHLSVSWTGLTSLSLSVPAPARLPAAAADGSDAVLAVSESPAYQLLVSLGSMQRLKHLNMTLAGEQYAAGRHRTLQQCMLEVGPPCFKR